MQSFRFAIALAVLPAARRLPAAERTERFDRGPHSGGHNNRAGSRAG
jgi:hypothetical protein